jgi:hypothetical protein
MRVKINRSEPRKPFLSNIVKGGAEQVTPNGTALDGPRPEPDGIQGAVQIPYWAIPDKSWGGNRSGE